MEMKYKHVGLLFIGHMVTDINQGALPALLPFLISVHHISYAAAAGIVFATNITSTIVQPLFGHAADRFSKPWILSAATFTAGLGLAMTGVVSSYHVIIALAVLSGLGIAAYHPEAARLVHFASGTKKGTAMSFFGVGGMFGFAIGPIFLTTAVLHWGMKGTLLLLIPVSVIAVLFLTQMSKLKSLEREYTSTHVAASEEEMHDEWVPFIRLTMTIVGRAIIFFGLNTFIPLYWINVLHQSKTVGATALTVMAVSSIVGNIMGGRLGDSIGHVKMIVIGFCCLIPILPALIWIKDPTLAMIMLIPLGMVLQSTYSPTIVMGQRYLPTRIGLSSGVTIGIAMAIGGVAAPVLGMIADSYGIWWALASIAFLPSFIAAVAFTLPDPGKLAVTAA